MRKINCAKYHGEHRNFEAAEAKADTSVCIFLHLLYDFPVTKLCTSPFVHTHQEREKLFRSYRLK